MTLPRSSPGSGPVVVETERGGVVESSLTFSYVPVDDSTGGGGGGGGGVMGGASRPSLVNLGGMLESPLLSNKKAKQSGESASYSGTYRIVGNFRGRKLSRIGRKGAFHRENFCRIFN